LASVSIFETGTPLSESNFFINSALFVAISILEVIYFYSSNGRNKNSE
jgi:hypothetical protein